MNSNGAGSVADAGGDRVPVQDAIADARTLVINVPVRFGGALWAAQHDGSRAVVAALDGDGPLAQTCAYFAAHAAFEAVPGLRG